MGHIHRPFPARRLNPARKPSQFRGHSRIRGRRPVRGRNQAPPWLHSAWKPLATAATATVAAASIALFLAGCAGASLKEGPGGLPQDQAARLSLIVAQTRAQSPHLAAGNLPFETREPASEREAPKPEPALRGKGTSMRPGLKSEKEEKIRVRLFLEKPRYNGGFLEAEMPGMKKESWPIVAYDLRGSPTGPFDFTYALATPDGKLRYLVVIGGEYGEGEKTFLGFEGTLVVPGPGNDLERWKIAYKIDFGYRFPKVPAHQRKVREAVRLFDSLEGDMDRIENAQEEIAALASSLVILRVRPPQGKPATETEQEIRGGETEIAGLRAALSEELTAAEDRLVEYYGLRKAIAKEYAAFVTTNLYLWRDRTGKQSYYDRWKVVEFHHPRIDEFVNRFLGIVKEGGRVLEARKAAMESVTRNNNWEKNPSKP